VVGHTGSGKSTLVGLVPRLMDPTAGCVLLDGIDLRDLAPAELRRHIGFVPQETFLFSATIAGNIAFGVESATEDGDPPRRGVGRAGLRYRVVPQGLRDHGGRARHHPFRRPEAAHRDRPRHPAQSRAS
jgi:ABC-type transport system involved in Fe-S cluster assembly fused permease/ATPase subunit